MPAKTHGERLDRLEEVVGILAESHISLEKTVAELATATRRGFDQVAAQFAAVTKRMDEDHALTEAQFRETARENAQRARETDERLRETDERLRETDEHIRETDEHIRETDEHIREMVRRNAQYSHEVDERIDKLVLAIAELIRRQDAPKA